MTGTGTKRRTENVREKGNVIKKKNERGRRRKNERRKEEGKKREKETGIRRRNEIVTEKRITIVGEVDLQRLKGKIVHLILHGGTPGH